MCHHGCLIYLEASFLYSFPKRISVCITCFSSRTNIFLLLLGPIPVTPPPSENLLRLLLYHCHSGPWCWLSSVLALFFSTYPSSLCYLLYYVLSCIIRVHDPVCNELAKFPDTSPSIIRYFDTQGIVIQKWMDNQCRSLRCRKIFPKNGTMSFAWRIVGSHAFPNNGLPSCTCCCFDTNNI